MLAIVTGIPGTGKTTVTIEAIKKLENDGVKYELMTYGDVMIDIAKSRGWVSDRDEMRLLKPEQQREIQRLAAKKIAELKENAHIIVDTHCTISTLRGYLPGLPEWVLRELNPDCFIIVESVPEEINERRGTDKSRSRDVEGIEGIALHQELNRDIAMAYSIFTGMTVKIIKNPQGKVDDAAKEMVCVLNDVD